MEDTADLAEPRQYDCLKCPGYCCSYPIIVVTRRDLARIARHGFGMRVLVWGREGTQAAAAKAGYAVAASQRALFEESDVLSLCVRLTRETRGIVSAEDLAAVVHMMEMITERRKKLYPNLRKLIVHHQIAFAGHFELCFGHIRS